MVATPPEGPFQVMTLAGSMFPASSTGGPSVLKLQRLQSTYKPAGSLIVIAQMRRLQMLEASHVMIQFTHFFYKVCVSLNMPSNGP